MIHVLVTRPRQQAQSLLSALADAGMQSTWIALIDIEPLDDPRVRDSIHNLDLYDRVIFTSRYAVDVVAPRIDQRWPQLPASAVFLAVGDKTAAVLRRYGIDALIAHQPGSEGLLDLPALATPRGASRVLLVKGRGGRTLLADTLRDRGFEVRVIDVYQRHETDVSGQLEALLRRAPPDVSIATSVEMCQRLARECAGRLTGIPLLVTSERIALEAKRLGFGVIIGSNDASDIGIMRALRTWASGQS